MSCKDKKYNPESYWEKRLSKNFSLTGVGHLGFGLEYNIWLYKARLHVINQLLKEKNVNCKGKKLLDIGVGTGFYIKFWEGLGVNNITGVDITTKAIEELKKIYPNHRFVNTDISSIELPINEKYDIITCFDVLYHIVDEEDFKHAIENIRKLTHETTIIFIMDSFLKKYKPARGHENDRTLKYYKKILDYNLITVEDIKPIYYFMNTPIDVERVNNRFLKFLIKKIWRLNLKMNSFCKKIGKRGKSISYLWAFNLYCIDCIILKYISIGPSTKLLFGKPKSERD